MNATAIHYAVWGGPLDAPNLSRILGEAAEIGFTYLAVPLRKLEAMDLASVKSCFANSTVRPLNTAGLSAERNIASDDASIRQRGRAYLKDAIRIARDMGSQQINGVLYGMIAKAARPGTAEELKWSADALSDAAEFAKDCGVRLAIEIVNRYESNLINTVAQGLDFLRLVDNTNLGLHLDTFHMALEEADPASALRGAMPHLFYFELCQSHRGNIKQGSLDLQRILSDVLAMNYQGLIGVEAFARDRLAQDHADVLAIWRNPLDTPYKAAGDAIALIRRAAGLPLI